jgi:sugar lactone lactonase YvrE
MRPRLLIKTALLFALLLPGCAPVPPATTVTPPEHIYPPGVTVTTVARQGGQGRLKVGPDGNIYSAEIWQYRLFLTTPEGAVSEFAGDGRGVVVDGPARAASFSEPAGLAFDRAGNLYVADSGLDHPHGRCLRLISPGGLVSTFTGVCAEEGRLDGPIAQARFVNPVNLSTDPDGNLLVADCTGGVIRKIDLSAGVVKTVAGSGELGHRDGPASQAQFTCPVAAVMDKQRNIYVADGNWQWGGCSFTLRLVTPDAAQVKTVAGSGEQGWRDGPAKQAQLDCISDLAVDEKGNVYLAETNRAVIRRYTPDSAGGTVVTLAGSGRLGSRDGPGAEAEFTGPLGLALDGKGHLYVGDYSHHIRRITLP